MPSQVSHAELASKKIRAVGPGEAALMRHVGDGHFKEWCEQLFEVLAEGKVKVKVHDTYPLSDMVRAHRDLEGRKTVGKLLVRP